MTRLDCISGAVYLPRALELCHDVESNPGPRGRAARNGGSIGLGSRAGTGSSSNSSTTGIRMITLAKGKFSFIVANNPINQCRQVIDSPQTVPTYLPQTKSLHFVDTDVIKSF